MKRKLKTLMTGAISIILLSSFFSGTSQATVIDFNGADNTAWLVLQNPYSEDGYTLNNSGIPKEPAWAAGLFWWQYSP